MTCGRFEFWFGALLPFTSLNYLAWISCGWDRRQNIRWKWRCGEKLGRHVFRSESEMNVQIDIQVCQFIKCPERPLCYMSILRRKRKKRKEADLLEGRKNTWYEFHFPTDSHKKLKAWPYGFWGLEVFKPFESAKVKRGQSKPKEELTTLFLF